MGAILPRRVLLRWIAVASGAVLVPFDRLVARKSRRPQVWAEDCAYGELYAGFLLLESSDPWPDCVVDPEVPMPNVCGLDGNANDEFAAHMTDYASVLALAGAVSIDLYELDPVLSGLAFHAATAMRTSEDIDYLAQISYKVSAATPAEPVIVIQAEAYFPQPQPLWEETADGDDPFDDVALEQVSFLPVNGVFVEIPDEGFTSYWIQDGVSYTMHDYHSATRTEAVIVAGLLSAV